VERDVTIFDGMIQPLTSRRSTSPMHGFGAHQHKAARSYKKLGPPHASAMLGDQTLDVVAPAPPARLADEFKRRGTNVG